MRVVTHIVFAEARWFITAAVFDVHYELPSVAAAAFAGILPDADYPKSWTGRMLGSVSEALHRFFGHRSFLHSYLALFTVTVGSLLWWIAERPAPLLAVFVGYGFPHPRRHDDRRRRPVLLAVEGHRRLPG